MKKLLIISALFLLPCLAPAQELDISLIVWNAGRTAVIGTNTISYDRAQTTNIQAAVDKEQATGPNSILRLRYQLMKRVKELTKNSQERDASDAAHALEERLKAAIVELPME